MSSLLHHARGHLFLCSGLTPLACSGLVEQGFASPALGKRSSPSTSAGRQLAQAKLHLARNPAAIVNGVPYIPHFVLYAHDGCAWPRLWQDCTFGQDGFSEVG
jgi:hypothetical protein